MSDLTDAITDRAQEPLKASGDSGSMEQRPIAELIEADRYVKGNAAAAKGLGMRHVKLVPPGASA